MFSLDFQDADFVCGRAGNISVAIWCDAPTLDRLQALRATQERMIADFPRGWGFLDIIVRGTPRFSDEIRAATADLIKVTDPHILGSAHVILMTGMVGVAVRTFISTVLLLGRAKAPTKVFGDVAAAGVWLAPLLVGTVEHPMTADAIAAAGEEAVGKAGQVTRS